MNGDEGIHWRRGVEALVGRRGSMCKGPEVRRKLEGQGPAKMWDSQWAKRKAWVASSSTVGRRR